MPIPGQLPALANLGDALSQAEFGLTPNQAISRGICVDCKQEALPRCHSEAGRREYKISGMCEVCFDSAFAED